MCGQMAAPRRAGDEGYDDVGGCRLLRRLDRQGTHAVYLARQPRLGNRLVVVKLTPVRQPVCDATTQSGGAASDDAAQLLSSARMLGQLAHPHILPLYDAGLADGFCYLMTQFVPDGSLADLLRDAPLGKPAIPPQPRLIADLMGQLASALQYMHNHGMVHGAVRPASVLVQVRQDGRWHLLLADAGSDSGPDVPDRPAVDGAMPAEGQWAPLAPEQHTGSATPASDQYALAALTHLLLTGRAPPLAPDSEPIASGNMVDIAASLRERDAKVAEDVPENVPEDMAQAIARALAPDPAERFPSVAAFAQALRAGCGEPPPAATAAQRAATASAASAASAGGSIAPVPRRLWLEAEHGLPLPPPAQRHAAWPGHHVPRRVALALAGLALLLGALALALRLPTVGGEPAVAGRPASTASRQVGIAGGQIATQASSGMAAAAPPPTPPGTDDRARVVARPAAVTVAPGQHVRAAFALVNTGTSVWSARDGYGLTCDRTRHPSSSCSRDMWIGLGAYTVAPGQQITFTVDLIAPTATGTYAVWWNMAHAGHLFSTPDVPLRILVQVPPSPTASPTETPTQTPTETPTPSPTPSPTDDTEDTSAEWAPWLLISPSGTPAPTWAACSPSNENASGYEGDNGACADTLLGQDNGHARGHDKQQP